MAGILLGTGAQEFLSQIQTAGYALQPGVGLFVNNYTPLWTSVTGNFTECTATGYARQGVNIAGASINVGSSPPGTITFPPLLFTFSAGLGQTVYGYFIYNGLTGTFWYAEKLTTSYAIPSGGGTFALTNTINITDS
jgi:hypothetical protein